MSSSRSKNIYLKKVLTIEDQGNFFSPFCSLIWGSPSELFKYIQPPGTSCKFSRLFLGTFVEMIRIPFRLQILYSSTLFSGRIFASSFRTFSLYGCSDTFLDSPFPTLELAMRQRTDVGFMKKWWLDLTIYLTQ